MESHLLAAISNKYYPFVLIIYRLAEFYNNGLFIVLSNGANLNSIAWNLYGCSFSIYCIKKAISTDD